MRTAYIYALTCPITDAVMYVGKTENVNSRLSRHLASSKLYETTAKGKWIESLLDSGLTPGLDVIEECTTDNWREREQYWISHYRKLNPSLKNSAHDVGPSTPVENSSNLIHFRLAEIAEAKGHTRSTLSKATNISYPTILLFWNDTVQKIDKDILERLCEFLDCQPGDLIQLTAPQK